MTFGRAGDDGFSTGLGAGTGGQAGHRPDAPYGDRLPDGFGGHGPAAEGFGRLAAPLEVKQATEGASGATGTTAATPAGSSTTSASSSTACADAGAAAAACDRLAVPPAIDFGEVVVGERPTEAGHVFNLHPSHLAYLSVSLAGSPEVALVSKPDRLRPSRDGLGPPIVLRFQPTKRTVARATLTLSASWLEGVWPATTVEVPVTARAYAPGERTHAEEDVAAAGAIAAGEQAKAGAQREAALEARVALDQRIDDPYPQGPKNDFDVAFEDAKAALAEVTDQQAGGVATANEEATAYRRAIPRSEPGLLFSLAMFGVDMATAGIAGSLASRLGARVSQRVKVGPTTEAVGDALIWTGSREVALNPAESVAMVVESFKTGFKDAGKTARKAAFNGDHAGGGGSGDSGARIEFFGEQRSELARSKAARSYALTDANRHLRPLLRSAPDQAVAAMRAIQEELLAVASESRETQALQSRVAWMRFLSQGALGSLDADDARVLGLRPGADGATLTDTRRAVVVPGEHEAMQDLPGVLDIEFAADYNRPEEPVFPTRARLPGIHEKMLRRLKSKTPRELGIVVRAHGTAPGMAVLPITVVRDEAGNVRFTDDTGAAGQESTWLSRKGGSRHASPERQRLGAMKLMDELIDRPLNRLSDLDTDHDGT